MRVFAAALSCFAAACALSAAAQEMGSAQPPAEEERVPRAYPPPPAGVWSVTETAEGQFTINLQAVPLEDFLALVSERTGRKFVLKPSVKGLRFTAFLSDVHIDDALMAIMEANDLAIRQFGPDILVVMEKEAALEEAEAEEAPQIQTEVVKLKYADADDVVMSLTPFLSPVGKIGVVRQSGFTGWEFATGETEGEAFGVRAREEGAAEGAYKREVRSQVLLVADVPEQLEVLKSLIAAVDVKPRQILITATIIEVTRGKLRDVGFDWATSSDGIESAANITTTEPWGGNVEFRGNALGSGVVPGNWPTTTGSSGAFPFDSGLSLLLKKVDGTQFEFLIHALEELADANVLSSPNILTLDNQEATILVGEKFPILQTETSGTDVAQLTTSLDYYESIGVQLNVLPQIQDDKYINMIIHPAISDRTGSVTAVGSAGNELAQYPIIETRETENQILIENGQAIVIGGLLKDVVNEEVRRIPFLGTLPIVGPLFRRTTRTVEKVDLMIFLLATIVEEPGEANERKVRESQQIHRDHLE